MEKNGAIGPSTPCCGGKVCGEKTAAAQLEMLDDDVTRRAAKAAQAALVGERSNEQTTDAKP